MNYNFFLKGKKEKKISELVLKISEKYYCKLKKISDTERKMMFISIISEVSNGIFDFYININRTNNVFYSNVNKLSQKLIDELFVLNFIYCCIKILDKLDESEKQEFLDIFFDSFNLSKKNKKLFKKCYEMYNKDEESFMLHFVDIFADKIFFTKNTDRMEFIYIDNYLENNFNSFLNSYESLFV